MEGLADIVTLCMIFALLIAGATILINWATYPLHSVNARKTQLKAQFLLFSLNHLQVENKTLNQRVLDSFLGVDNFDERVLENILSFYLTGGFVSVTYYLDNQQLTFSLGKKQEQIVSCSSSFVVIPANGDPVRMLVKVDVG